MKVLIVLVGILLLVVLLKLRKMATASLPSQACINEHKDDHCDVCPSGVGCDCTVCQPDWCKRHYAIVGDRCVDPNYCASYCKTCCGLLEGVIKKSLTAGSCSAAALALSATLALLAPELIPFDAALGLAFRTACGQYATFDDAKAHIPDMAKYMCQQIGKSC